MPSRRSARRLLLILDPPQPRNMTKANSALSPLAVGRHDIFGHKRDRRGLADQLVLVRVGFRRDQGEHGGAVRRRNADPALSGLKTHIKGQVESELIQVESQASVLIADENVNRVHAEVGRYRGPAVARPWPAIIRRQNCDQSLERRRLISDRCQRLIEIVHDVFHVFDSHGNADQAVCNFDLAPPFSPSAAWVMVAGCEIRVSTPPRDSASEHTRTFFNILLALERDPVSKVIIEPKPVICCCARSCCGCSGRPG